MTKFYFTLLFLFGVHFLNAQIKERPQVFPVYKAHKTASAIKIDGKIDDKAWDKAEPRNLNYYYFTPKGTEQKTTFRMLWDNDNIYLFYECTDKYINANEKNRDGAPYLDDCIEFFVTTAPTIENAHFCFEINVIKTINDIVFLNNFYGDKNAVVKAYNPDITMEMQIDGTLNNNTDIDKGWTAEIAIPHKAFLGSTGVFPINKGSKWSFTAIRKNRDTNETINKTATWTMFPVDDFIKGSDVHKPESFGVFEFVD